MSVGLEVAVAQEQQIAAPKPIYCQRCHNRRPLGLLSPGRFTWRGHGRTVTVEGGTVTVVCERCGNELTLMLDEVPSLPVH